jgi:hypothetical protein
VLVDLYSEYNVNKGELSHHDVSSLLLVLLILMHIRMSVTGALFDISPNKSNKGNEAQRSLEKLTEIKRRSHVLVQFQPTESNYTTKEN